MCVCVCVCPCKQNNNRLGARASTAYYDLANGRMHNRSVSVFHDSLVKFIFALSDLLVRRMENNLLTNCVSVTDIVGFSVEISCFDPFFSGNVLLFLSCFSISLL